MYLIIDVKNSPIKIKLDWVSKTWQLEEDQARMWKNNISSASQGMFSKKDWSVMWLMGLNPKEPIVILWDSPNGQSDASRSSGLARVHSQSSPLHNSKLPWRVAATAKVKVKPMTPLRTYVVQELEKSFKDSHKSAIAFGDKRYNRLLQGVEEIKTGTNCYILGTGIAKLAAEFKGMKTPDDITKYAVKYSLGATTGLPAKAKNGSWRDAGWIYPIGYGDFFALLKPELTNTEANRKSTQITHVSALLSIDGNTWRTADFGQISNPGGYGVLRTRKYDPANNTLSSPGSAYKPRVLAGWVDIDQHFSS